jgi:hypothetical protein
LVSNGTVSFSDFFKDIVSLSYMGDIRTYLKAERKDKIDNVVLGAFEQYMQLYGDFFKKYEIEVKDGMMYINPLVLDRLYDNIPEAFLEGAKILSGYYMSAEEFKSLFLAKLSSRERRIIFERYIRKLNLHYSVIALLTGLYSSNISKIVTL